MLYDNISNNKSQIIIKPGLGRRQHDQTARGGMPRERGEHHVFILMALAVISLQCHAMV